MPVTVVAVYTYHKEGFIDWRYVGIIALFFVVGGYFGSKIAVGLDQKMLKKVFGLILLFKTQPITSLFCAKFLLLS